MQFLARLSRQWSGFVLISSLAVLISCGGSSSTAPAGQAPSITTQPASATISSGQTTTLSVSATGSSPLNYQWYQGNSGDTTTPVGANSSSFSSPPLAASTDYWVKVSNSAGSVNSATVVVTVTTPPPNAIPSAYFGMHMNGGTISQQPWPVVPFGAVRLWDADVSWSDLAPSGPMYDFTNMTKWFQKLKANNPSADVLYTFGRTPPWATSNPNDTNCGFAPGSCDPPSDLNPDGTGTDQFFKDYVTAVVNFSAQNTTGHIKYYEILNEAANAPTWTGTVAQTVRMTTDAAQIIRTLDHSAVILSPSVVLQSSDGQNFLRQYFPALHSAGGEVDAIAYHGYVQQDGEPLRPEDLVTNIGILKNILSNTGEGSKPVFDTEAGWGDPTVSNPTFTDPDLQAGFVARFYLLHWSENTARFYWYQWNNKSRGTLWTPDPNSPTAPGTLLKPGVAYGQVYNWLVGAVMSQGCTNSGSVWSCELTRPGGYQALAAWDVAQSCRNGTCTTSNFNFPSQYRHALDLMGNTTALSGSTVAIGAKPILLENQ